MISYILFVTDASSSRSRTPFQRQSTPVRKRPSSEVGTLPSSDIPSLRIVMAGRTHRFVDGFRKSRFISYLRDRWNDATIDRGQGEGPASW